MRARLPALVIAACLLAGCSDPAGAAREERRKAARQRAQARPSPSGTATQPPAARPRQRPSPWWQAPGKTVTSGGLRVRSGRLAGGRVTLVVTDLRTGAVRRITATATPRSAAVGRFRLTRIMVSRSPGNGDQGIGFRYVRAARPGSPRGR